VFLNLPGTADHLPQTISQIFNKQSTDKLKYRKNVGYSFYLPCFILKCESKKKHEAAENLQEHSIRKQKGMTY
jgi:hypothetical protein